MSDFPTPSRTWAADREAVLERITRLEGEVESQSRTCDAHREAENRTFTKLEVTLARLDERIKHHVVLGSVVATIIASVITWAIALMKG